MHLRLVTCAILVFALAPAKSAVAAHIDGGEAAAECVGCHTAKRTQPESRFPNGLGRWTDANCYGCHAELNEVAERNARGVRDARYFAVPMSEELLASLARHPLAYMSAPAQVESPRDGIPRIAPERLATFLRRPANLSPEEGSRAPRMMAYPSLETRELKRLAALLGVKLNGRTPTKRMNSAIEEQRIQQLWTTQCVPCHGGERPVSGRSGVALGLYTADWIEAYANGKAVGIRAGRKMPVFSLSRSDAEGLYQLLGAMRGEKERVLDAHVSRLKLEDPGSVGQVPDAFVSYLWGPFFRDATCVHCHATNSRAGHAFRADAAGLQAYLQRKSGMEFWRRLETRALEAEHGLTAASPGMPMAGVELPAEVRKLIGRWVRQGCRAPDGKKYCPKG